METIHSFRLVSQKLLVHHGLISDLQGLTTISRYSMFPALLSSTHPGLPMPQTMLSLHLSRSRYWTIVVNRLLLTFYFIIISFTWNNFLLQSSHSHSLIQTYLPRREHQRNKPQFMRKLSIRDSRVKLPLILLSILQQEQRSSFHLQSSSLYKDQQNHLQHLR